MMDIKKFVLAGKAIFTLESTNTLVRYTYKVVKNKESNMYFVMLLTGSDNSNDYTYIGIIVNGKFRLTKNSKMNFKSKPVVAFNFFMYKLHKLDAVGLKVYHEGKCGKCGRKLTTPHSIKVGFGPICEKLM